MDKRLYLILPFTILLISAGFTLTQSKFRPLTTLIANDSIQAKAVGLGGYQEQCTEISYQSTTNDSLYIALTPGTVLVNDDTSKQDILIIKQELLALSAMESGKISPRGFCCKAHRGSPNSKSIFSRIKMGKKELVLLANYLNDKSYSTNAIQHAIWAVSDNNPIASIPEGKLKENIPLRKFVAQLLEKTSPWYNIEYKKDTVPFTNEPVRIYGDLPFTTRNICLVDIVLFDEEGNKLKIIKMGMPVQPGEHSFYFDEKEIFEPNKTYYVKLFYDRALRVTKKIEL